MQRFPFLAPLSTILLAVALLTGCSETQENLPNEQESPSSKTPESETQMPAEDDVKADGKSQESAALPNLGERLAARKAESAKTAPAAMRELFAGGIEQVRESGITESAKQVGDKAPTGELKSVAGEAVELESLWADGPVVLVWYRGGWCPYCNMQLEAMQESLPAIKQLGAKVVALTPELPPKAAATREKLRVGFQVLSDPSNELAKKFGLVFKLPPEVAKVYKERIKLEEYNGDDSYELPLSAVYVIDQTGTIRYAFLDADYTNRAEPSDIVAALEKLAL